MIFYDYLYIINQTKITQTLDFAMDYIKKLIKHYREEDIVKMEYNCPLIAIKTFIPLPTKLLLNDNLYKDNYLITYDNITKTYQFKGNPESIIILFGNNLLPYKNDDNISYPIPFAFPIYTDVSLDIILSNVYYYEVTIKYDINKDFENNYLAIGFGYNNITLQTFLGAKNSIGFNMNGLLKDGFQNNLKKSNIISSKWKPGDTIGAGIIYISSIQIKPFFTFNGKLIYKSSKLITINNTLCPMINYTHSHSINVNFSNQEFIFKLQPFILLNSNNIISTDNSFINNYNLDPYIPNLPKNNNLPQLMYNFIFPIISSIMQSTDLDNEETSNNTLSNIMSIGNSENQNNDNIIQSSNSLYDISTFNIIIPKY